MKNFFSFNYTILANGSVYADTSLLPRSIVTLNEKGKGFCIQAKCRKTDIFSVFRALAKAVHASKFETDSVNACEEMKESGKTVQNVLNKALNAHLVAVTDKNGQIMQNAIISIRETENDSTKLRNLFRINERKETLYKSLWQFGLDWNNETINNNLNMWVTATIKSMHYIKSIDIELERAANSTEKEQTEKAKEDEKEQQTKNAKEDEKLKECFTILGLKGNESFEEIKTAFKQKVKESHPDKNGGSTAKMQAVNGAFEYIKKAMKFAA